MKSVDAAFTALRDRPASSVAVKIVPRICSVCGCADQIVMLEGEYDAQGNKSIRHHVTVELRYLRSRSDCTQRHEAQGWRSKIHQGRQAMERFICRPDLEARREMSKEFSRKRNKELGEKNHDPYYGILCGD